ncbi:MAG: hypothetical protein KDC56_00750 [Flavobacteriaceae bacterium]|nr:hypothetical protein [Flavobacteriaceae bacterium]
MKRKGGAKLEEILSKNSAELIAHQRISDIYMWEDYLDRSKEILEDALKKFKNDDSLLATLSECHKKSEGIDKAIEYLQGINDLGSPQIAIRLSNMLQEKTELELAREVIHPVYLNFLKNRELSFHYATLLMDLGENESAIYLLNKLTIDYPESASYWGYLSNCAVNLEYYDLALTACKKAEELSESKQEWIIANIGNIYKNRGFYSEAIIYLQKSLELDSSSEYSHDRLSTTLKLKKEESDKIDESIKIGRRNILDFGKKDLHTT